MWRLKNNGKTVAGKGVEEFRPYVTRSIPVGAEIVCADNSGAKILEIINVPRHKTRVSRLPAAAVGDFCKRCCKKRSSRIKKTSIRRSNNSTKICS